MNIDHKLVINHLLGCFEETVKYEKYSVIDGESFDAMDFSKLAEFDVNCYVLCRDGFMVPHRIYIANKGNSWTVYGR
jgi:hypothetical protein